MAMMKDSLPAVNIFWEKSQTFSIEDTNNTVQTVSFAVTWQT